MCAYNLFRNPAKLTLSNPGQLEEETRPDVNSFKITAYKHAIRSVSQFQQPILLGNDISKVCDLSG
jgi:hypothetical protein